MVVMTHDHDITSYLLSPPVLLTSAQYYLLFSVYVLTNKIRSSLHRNQGRVSIKPDTYLEFLHLFPHVLFVISLVR